jgi:hypothetical protein
LGRGKGIYPSLCLILSLKRCFKIGGGINVVIMHVKTTTLYIGSGSILQLNPMEATIKPTSPLGIIPTPIIVAGLIPKSIAPKPQPTILPIVARMVTTKAITIS